jgi:hypothetical protein
LPHEALRKGVQVEALPRVALEIADPELDKHPRAGFNVSYQPCRAIEPSGGSTRASID